MEIDSFFAGHPESLRLFEALRRTIEALGPAEIRVMKSQVVFGRTRPFAWVWRPGQYLRGQAAPLVLTLSFSYRDRSSRWKEIVQPRPGRFTHHLELRSSAEIDAEVEAWLRSAWESAA